jgi:hypothetical protein
MTATKRQTLFTLFTIGLLVLAAFSNLAAGWELSLVVTKQFI